MNFCSILKFTYFIEFYKKIDCNTKLIKPLKRDKRNKYLNSLLKFRILHNIQIYKY